MDRREYAQRRSELGQALRDLRWERKAIQLMFQGARTGELIQAGSEWVQRLDRMDIEICRQIMALDQEYANGG